MRTGAILLALALFPAPAGAQGAARCVEIEGGRILAKHLAQAWPAFSKVDPEQPLGIAPAPGARRILSPRELARLADKHGIETPASAEMCFERAMEKLTGERVFSAIREAVGRRDARIEVVDFSRYPVPRGLLEFPRSGVSAPPAATAPAPVVWRGRVRYDGSRSVPVWARVKILVPCMRVVAAENLAAGRPIGSAQARLEPGERFPFSEAPLDSLEQVLGKAPRRSLRVGTVLFAGLLAAPREVERGEEVAVEVLSGAAQLRFRGRAESAGRAGDVIVVKNPASGRRFAARVEGERRVVVDARFKNDLSAGGALPAGAAGSGR